MSSDDEELAALRAARVARGGGLTVVRKRERERERERERQRDVLDGLCRRDKRGIHSSASSLTSLDLSHTLTDPALYIHKQTAQRQAAMGGRENGSGGGERRRKKETATAKTATPPAANGDATSASSSSSSPPASARAPDDDDEQEWRQRDCRCLSEEEEEEDRCCCCCCSWSSACLPEEAPTRRRRKRKEEERRNGGASSPTTADSGEERGLRRRGRTRPNPFRLPVSRSALFEPTERGVTAWRSTARGRASPRVPRRPRAALRLWRREERPEAFPVVFPHGFGGGGGGDGGETRGRRGGRGDAPRGVPVLALRRERQAGGGGAEEALPPGAAASGGGALLLVACADARLVLCDREGRRLCESARGDSYLADPKNTAGHTAPLTCCCCLGGAERKRGAPPRVVEAACRRRSSVVDLDAGARSPRAPRTARSGLWAVLYDADRDAFSLKQRVVIKVPSAPGGGAASSNRRTKVSALAFLASSAAAAGAASSPCSPARNPSLLVAGTDDGAIHAWDPRARKGRPAAAGAVVTGPTARMMGLSARQKDWAFVAGSSTSTSRSVFGAHGGGGRGALPPALARASRRWRPLRHTSTTVPRWPAGARTGR